MGNSTSPHGADHSPLRPEPRDPYLYTDGITESFGETGEEFGEHRLIGALQSHSELPAQALIEVIVQAVRRFSPQEQHDDITLIVGKCRASN
jgi:serine phosphatase RsbU (regulator of sigma subunit)